MRPKATPDVRGKVPDAMGRGEGGKSGRECHREDGRRVLQEVEPREARRWGFSPERRNSKGLSSAPWWQMLDSGRDQRFSE